MHKNTIKSPAQLSEFITARRETRVDRLNSEIKSLDSFLEGRRKDAARNKEEYLAILNSKPLLTGDITTDTYLMFDWVEKKNTAESWWQTREGEIKNMEREKYYKINTIREIEEEAKELIFLATSKK